MNQHTALFALAYRHREIHFVCETCGVRHREPSEILSERLGPLTPLFRVGRDRYCRKCGSIEIRVEAG